VTQCFGMMDKIVKGVLMWIGGPQGSDNSLQAVQEIQSGMSSAGNTMGQLAGQSAQGSYRGGIMTLTTARKAYGTVKGAAKGVAAIPGLAKRARDYLSGDSANAGADDGANGGDAGNNPGSNPNHSANPGSHPNRSTGRRSGRGPGRSGRGPGRPGDHAGNVDGAGTGDASADDGAPDGAGDVNSAGQASGDGNGHAGV